MPARLSPKGGGTNRTKRDIRCFTWATAPKRAALLLLNVPGIPCSLPYRHHSIERANQIKKSKSAEKSVES